MYRMDNVALVLKSLATSALGETLPFIAGIVGEGNKRCHGVNAREFPAQPEDQEQDYELDHWLILPKCLQRIGIDTDRYHLWGLVMPLIF